jgi:hypothetical protein
MKRRAGYAGVMRLRLWLRVQEGTVSARRDPRHPPPRGRIAGVPVEVDDEFEDYEDDDEDDLDLDLDPDEPEDADAGPGARPPTAPRPAAAPSRSPARAQVAEAIAPPVARRRSALGELLARGGIVAPELVIREAARAGLRLELACALLEKESGGGRNVFGNDPTIFAGAGAVTRSKYAEYKRRRVASGNRLMQGVGPCQLTWWELQDQADEMGGCWRPRINMRVGFGRLADLTRRHGESDGVRRYGGSGESAEVYSRDVLVKARRWRAIIDSAPAAAVRRQPPAPQGPAPPVGARLDDEPDPPSGASEFGELIDVLARIEGQLNALSGRRDDPPDDAPESS